MKNSVKVVLLLLLVMLICSTSVFCNPDNADNYWPKETWRTSTPEAQGMDSERIYRMLKFVKENLNVHSVLIIRNGYLVTESYFAPYQKDIQQNIYSCTKSFTSALVGIALREGYIKDIRQKAVDFFPEYTFAGLDDRKKVMTVENLLAMSSGLEWVEHSPNEWRDPFYQKDVAPMIQSPDPVQFILDHPMREEPGTRFYYNTGASHLLSAIIRKTSGMTPFEFANSQLFKPIGIINPEWPSDEKGTNWGGMQLRMTPLDMARFGYLYLRHGEWDGKQIIPEAWVETSTKEHINFKPDAFSVVPYGYQWWITSYGYNALGWGGQYIFVVPKSNLVVVFTSGGADLSQIMENYIIPAVKSDQPLPPNKKLAKEIQKLLQEIENPTSQPVPPLPAIAAKISGKTISLSPNDIHAKALSVTFNPKNSCSLKFTWEDNNSREFPLGLDGVYRKSDIIFNGNPRIIAFKGKWQSANSFLINFQILQEAERRDLLLTIDGNEVAIQYSDSVNGPLGTITGKLQE